MTLPQIGAIAASVLAGLLLGWLANSSVGRRSVRRSRQEADEIAHQARQEAEHRQKEARLAARDELRKSRRRADREFRDKKTKLKRFESNLSSKEAELAATRARSRPGWKRSMRD